VNFLCEVKSAHCKIPMTSSLTSKRNRTFELLAATLYSILMSSKHIYNLYTITLLEKSEFPSRWPKCNLQIKHFLKFPTERVRLRKKIRLTPTACVPNSRRHLHVFRTRISSLSQWRFLLSHTERPAWRTNSRNQRLSVFCFTSTSICDQQ